MHYAILAAGEGSRLRGEGLGVPKPLLEVGGKPLIMRLIEQLLAVEAESIAVVCRSDTDGVKACVEEMAARHTTVRWQVAVGATASSMHSLALLAPSLPDEKVCVLTVDTFFSLAVFQRYIRAFQSKEGCLFAVTPYVDDERPLWVVTAAAGEYPEVTAFVDNCEAFPADAPRLVSGGIYGLEMARVRPVLQAAIASGQHRMRNFQRALLTAGVPIYAFVFPKILDIDHFADQRQAEAWIAAEERRVLCLARHPAHSPHFEAADAAILHATANALQVAGYHVTTCGEEALPAALEDYDVIVHMARQTDTLQRLSRLHRPLVVNDPRAVLNVSKSRELTFSLLQAAGIDVPRFWAYDPEDDEMFQCDKPLQSLLPAWVKGTRPTGAQAGDVTYVDTPLAADTCVLRLCSERVPDIIVMEHVEGDLLKVYAVADGDTCTLFTRYPQETGHSKFGVAETHNPAPQHYTYSSEVLRTLLVQVAHTLSLSVFGVDVIVTPAGRLVVIDVNDWPSFSSCRDEAAQAILLSVDHACRRS